MNTSYVLDNDLVSAILGSNDRNLNYIEFLLGSELSVRGNVISSTITSTSFLPLMERLSSVARENGELSESEIYMEFQSLNENSEAANDFKTITVMGRAVHPKSKTQRAFLQALSENQLVFASGPAGTGKTFLAVAWALSEVLGGKKNKIIITRPVVEAGESLGFLPGDLSKKLDPYLRPLYDAMEYILTPAQIKRMEDNGTIEVAPLAYMRGRSLNNAVIILDEAQNATRSQMKMFLTRIGESSKAIVTGDATQIDLQRSQSSGFVEAMRLLHDINGISVINFTSVDTVRSHLVRDIIDAYEKESYC